MSILTIIQILMIVRLIIAVQLTRVSFRKNERSLLWLAGFFYATCVGDFCQFVIGVPLVFSVGLLVGDIFVALFIRDAFYRDRKSPYLFFVGWAIFFGVISLAGSFPDKYNPIWNPFNWLWLIFVAYQAYRQIAKDKFVEDWVKARYLIVIAGAVVYLWSPLTSIGGTFSDTIFSLSLYGAQFAILSTVLQYAAWVMPDFFRRFLDRNYRKPAQDAQAFLSMSKEELLAQVQGK